MIDTNLLSYGFSVTLILIGIVMFLFSRFRAKYLNGFIILSLGARICYWLFIEMGEVYIGLKISFIFFVSTGILSSAIGVLLSNDGRTKRDVKRDKDE